MARANRPREHQVVWFAIDGWVRWDVFGWDFVFRTPLFGLGISRNWPDFLRDGRQSRTWLGLVARWPTIEGGILYMWNWERKHSFLPYHVHREVEDR